MIFQSYTKRPVTIKAVQWNGTRQHADEIIDIINANGREAAMAVRPGSTPGILITMLEGIMEASPYDYIICEPEGEYYPCKPDIFRKSYTI